MANRFKPNRSGYIAVMNGPELTGACEAQAGRLAASASAQSGSSYRIDSRKGVTRNHTRVSTISREDFFRERRLRALAIVAGQYGRAAGSKGYRSVGEYTGALVRRTKRRYWQSSYSSYRVTKSSWK